MSNHKISFTSNLNVDSVGLDRNQSLKPAEMSSHGRSEHYSHCIVLHYIPMSEHIQVCRYTVNTLKFSYTLILYRVFGWDFTHNRATSVRTIFWNTGQFLLHSRSAHSQHRTAHLSDHTASFGRFSFTRLTHIERHSRKVTPQEIVSPPETHPPLTLACKSVWTRCWKDQQSLNRGKKTMQQ